ncbi:MAG TPA: GNAT family N-acetyltransferase [Mycobacteriales bacterium]|nr:GNAT family N-acetyltransferase [Mycobacteriales bacterium]
MDLGIVEIDPDVPFEADRRDWHELNLAARRVDLPDDPPPVYWQSVRRLMTPASGERRRWFARDASGRLLGGVVLTRHGYENAHLANVDVRVHPDARRHGIGRTLFDTAAGTLAGRGVTTLFAFSPESGPGAAFAEAMGMAKGHDGLRGVLGIAETDPAEVARLAAGADARTDGFSLVRWAGRCPDELIGAYAVAQAGMNDAPTGKVDWRPVTLTAERIRRTEKALAGWGERPYVLAVRQDATGALAGLTEVDVMDGAPVAEQDDTTVLAGYRGRGFGLWLKAAMVVWLAEAEPHVTRYETFNAAENTHMLAVNHRLGYRTADVWCEWTRPVG